MMKKIVFALVVLMLVALASVYILVPGKLDVSTVKKVNTVTRGIEKYWLGKEAAWLKWWPGGDSIKKGDHPVLRYNGITYTVTSRDQHFIDIRIGIGDSGIHSRLSFIPIRFDSVALQWEFVLDAGMNPFKRISAYRQAKSMKNDLAFLLEKFRTYAEQSQNIYGFTIRKIKVTDTLFIATRFTTSTYPSMQLVYEKIKLLKENLEAGHAVASGAPILNVTKIGTDNYENMVALPTITEIIPSGGNIIRRMILGNILVTEVKGGLAAIGDAYMELDNYRRDYHLETPAIPFEALITDRTTVADSTLWITKVYFPVF